MPTPENPKPEHPSTYFVEDRSNLDEMNRLQIQDRMLTEGMGGVLVEQPDSERFERVLDVGCGTGGWLIEVAKTYPSISLLVGIDISQRMLDFARARAEAEGVSDRVEFHVMDALRMLEFPNDFFSLVNQRLGWGYLRTWDWPKLLQEFQRVARPGGVVRVTESDLGRNTSSAAMQLIELSQKAFYQSGHLFTPTGDGVIGQLARLLQRHGLQNVRTRTYTLEYPFGSPGWQLALEDMRLVYRTMRPFLEKWVHIPDNYEEIYQQALRDVQQPDCVGGLTLLTAWGTKSV
ncbi:MAG TPA: methyltransferase domain-containing protein [Ktedonobacteraceae bacterium]|nr:methyltransferase domain-containing protein [Ktedonobacteraceae bacterium]